MKASFRTWLSVWLGAAVFMLLLSGCGVSLFRSAEDLFVQPQLPEEYKNLNATIEQVKSSLDAEQTAPLTGSNTSAIQLLDLNSDGEEEAAVAFFRSNSSDDPQPLKIYIFRMGSDGTYQIAYRIQGEGNNVGSIAYRDLDGDGIVEIPTQPDEAGLLNLSQSRRMDFIVWMDYTSSHPEKSFGLLDEETNCYIELPAEWEGNLKLTDSEEYDGAVELRTVDEDELVLTVRLARTSANSTGWTRLGVVASRQLQARMGPGVLLADTNYRLSKALYLLN